MHRPSELTLTEDGNGTAVVTVAGDLDSATSPQLRSALNVLAQQCPSEVFIDLSDTGFMDASGVHVLAEAHGQLAARGTTLILCSPSKSARKVLQLTGFAAAAACLVPRP
jgi:anti-anti-sigma factor